MEIVDDTNEILLNKQSKVISQYHHQNGYKLKFPVTNKKDRGIT